MRMPLYQLLIFDYNEAEIAQTTFMTKRRNEQFYLRKSKTSLNKQNVAKSK